MKNLFISIFISLACVFANTLTAKRKTNFIIILADDLGYNDLSCQGSKDIKSPSIDNLASEGIRFENGYASHCYCGPSRTGLITGRFAQDFGMQMNLCYDPFNPEVGVPTEATFLSEILQKNGYRTGMIGKWHLGASEKFIPNNRGFDFFYGFLGGGHNYFLELDEQRRNNFLSNTKNLNSEGLSYAMPLLHNKTEVNPSGYLTDVLSQQAVEFVKSNKNKPFFLYLAYNAPHTPLEAKKEDLEKFNHISNPERRRYAAMIYNMDKGIGQLIEQLKKDGTYKNTVIIFFSDNGGIGSWCDNSPLRGNKGTIFEGGFRVPFIISWPNKIKSKLSSEMISSLDLYPTLLSIAGIKIPNDLDGIDVSKYLIGRSKTTGRTKNFMGEYSITMRDGDWKFIDIKYPTKETLLYNLKDDISETKDLSKENPQKVSQLKQELTQWGKTHVKPKFKQPEQYMAQHQDTTLKELFDHYRKVYGVKVK